MFKNLLAHEILMLSCSLLPLLAPGLPCKAIWNLFNENPPHCWRWADRFWTVGYWQKMTTFCHNLDGSEDFAFYNGITKPSVCSLGIGTFPLSLWGCEPVGHGQCFDFWASLSQKHPLNGCPFWWWSLLPTSGRTRLGGQVYFGL